MIGKRGPRAKSAKPQRKRKENDFLFSIPFSLRFAALRTLREALVRGVLPCRVNPDPTPIATNRLAREKSPYLLQHAHNPVDWYPWGEEAFEKARREDKPIFLSVGYSTCHWCHVMAHESFENPATAAVMNDLFVNIKVDREERPDVDLVYMTFVQATTGSGGWPMSVWLQPDLKPIVGGTYFPPDDRYGRRGFVSVCQTIARAWHEDRAKVLAQGDRIIESLRDYAQPAPAGASGKRQPVEPAFRAAEHALRSAFDPEYGGFGTAPKFPRPVLLTLLTRIAARLGWDGPEQSDLREMVLVTLEKMADGGMHDGLGGGFHRYSVDRFWHVPHFEKMLYDQAQLAVAYLEGFQLSARADFAEVARDILAYVRRDLRSPEGGFYCAEDADSLIAHGRPEHAEGAFYVWTRAEVEAALTPGEARAFCNRYDVRTEGNAPDGSDPQGEFTGKNILFQSHLPGAEDASLLASARKKLFDLRARRPRPHLDDKIVTAWNGLMISAFARAARVLDDSTYLEDACRAANFLRQHLYREADGILLRSYREGPANVEGFADDYAFLIQGLLDLYEAGFDPAHLAWAEQLQTKQDELFYDPQAGGYFSTSERDKSVLLRLKEDHDGAEPSASSVAALNLARLAALTGRDELLARAEATVAAFGVSDNPARSAQTMPLLFAATDFLSRPPRQVVIVGHRDAADARAMLRVVNSRFTPDLVLMFADGGDGQRELAKRLPHLEGATMQDGRATAYLCQNQTCQLPTTDPAELARRLFAIQNGDAKTQ